jgi:hypothetical protein
MISACPLYPQKQTSQKRESMTAKGQQVDIGDRRLALDDSDVKNVRPQPIAQSTALWAQ